jgi:hypothetical protein
MTERDDPLADRDAFAHSLGELRPGLPDPGDVFATLQRVIDATRAVFQVDRASAAQEHEDGSLRWVVVTDGAVGLLEDARRDLGEDPAWPRMPTRRSWWSRTWTPAGRWGRCRCMRPSRGLLHLVDGQHANAESGRIVTSRGPALRTRPSTAGSVAPRPPARSDHAADSEPTCTHPITTLALWSCLRPRIGPSRAFRRPWSVSTPLAYRSMRCHAAGNSPSSTIG